MADAIVKTCRKCGERFTVRCKPCARIAMIAWRKAHPGRAAEIAAGWRARNPEPAKACALAYRSEHSGEIKAKTATWRKANPEKANAGVEAYRAANKEKVAAMHAAYREANREKIKAANAAWYKKNSVKARADTIARYAANPEIGKAQATAWAKAHPEAKRIIHQNRRARKKANGGKLSAGLTERLLQLQRGLCACCGKPLGKNYHLDHWMPLALGGTNTDDNMRLLTQRCNNQKGARHPMEFMKSCRGLLLETA